MICPNCGHEFKDPAKVKGGQKSKRIDMKKGSSGQKKAQQGRKESKMKIRITTP